MSTASIPRGSPRTEAALYGGTLAFMSAALFGATHGIFYLFARRNLLPLVAVHGTWDMVGICGVYNS